jgi:ornithine cyclodeaminase/alanine dehydrogenase-like protein (mu-crystallin family)
LNLLYLAREQVAGLLPEIPAQLDLVEETYAALAAGRVELPPKPGVHPRENSFIHAMPAYLADQDVAALKWVSGYPGNKARGLPYISGLLILSDAETGLPLAVMDAAEITAARTAAASGVCIRRWAPDGWSTAAILGCGEQGRFHARLLNELNPDVTIRAFDPHPERSASLEGRIEQAPDVAAAVQGAEVVVSAVPIVERPEPPISTDWLGERYLALPIDFDALFQPGPIEDAELFLVDDVGQFEYYRTLGHFQDWPEPAGNVGSALASDGSPDRVACVNLGIGALDAAFGKVVYDRAREEGIGTDLPL